jgi:hypothetical protein
MTRTTEDLKKIIANLLETSGRTEDEIRTMQAKAAKIMHQLGLTRADIFAEKPDMFSSHVQITRFDWIVAQYLMSAVTDLTGTECWYEIMPTPTGKRSDRKLIYFAGYRSDVDQATWLFQHVLEQAGAGSRGINVTSQKNSYLVGFASTVARRIRDLAKAMKTMSFQGEALDVNSEEATENALVLAKKEEVVKAFLSKLAPGLTEGQDKGSVVKDGRAFNSGRSDGAKASLGRGVEKGVLALSRN